MNAVPPNASAALPAGIPADPFQPLTPAERQNAVSAGGKDEVWEPQSPAPCEPELPRGASAMWVYRDAEGRPLCARFRKDLKDGKKDIRPLTYGRRVWIDEEGRHQNITGWHWKQAAKPLPLYGLDRLAARPDAPVLLVEGEKTADAAQRLFPDYVAMTSQGGGKAVGNNDWSPLGSRTVTIWPDNDEPGMAYADAAITAMREAGALIVRQVALPAGLPHGWDVADDVPPELIGGEIAGVEFLRPYLDQAPLAEANVKMPPGYAMTGKGLQFLPEQTGDVPVFPVWISAPFDVVAETNDGDGFGWGLLIRWLDRDRREHQWAIPKRMVHGEGKDIAGELEDAGLNCSISATRYLRQFIASVHTKTRLRCVDRAGWHRTDDGHAFILPGGFTIGGGRRSVVFQSSRATVGREFTPGGTLADWQKQVAAYAVGNSRLALFVSAAFAGPLLDIMGEQSGGIHLVGKSQSGKSTSAFIAGSVWGKGDRDGQIRAWRGTANGLEGIASETSDTVLILDEMGQAEPREVGEIAYMLANNTGKQRAGRNGDARARKTWRVLFLSTGEVTLAAKMGEAGKRAMAGQEVRLVNIPADAGAGMGAFEQLHGMRSAGALADHLRVASRTFYGEASRHFLDALVRDRAADPKALEAVIRAIRSRFEESYVPAGNVDGQVRSVAARFALIAAAGELATDYGVLPWERGEALKAAGACFQAWLGERGSVGASEDVKAVEQVRAFIEQHGESRFTNLERLASLAADLGAIADSKTINRAGFKRKVETPDGDRWEYLILPVMWKTEICKGLDAANVAKVVRDAGYLVPGNDGKSAQSIRIPGEGRLRLYVVTSKIMGGTDA
ncbi:DUF927 domain-containing protein [Gluconacetobacter aggeris]|uniref:DUF927 domain-containing protein n=1 Tax=Gluconacetobacter aggeris TaxID=1286186 RepID=A0A7W4IWQ1_9PROT|nr:DUF927 domain-containing protein [Gluconacetobacter aggeris]MBB2170436.1 DUF927 domain-containing protein [Gluconacetobacter aggeris]